MTEKNHDLINRDLIEPMIVAAQKMMMAAMRIEMQGRWEPETMNELFVARDAFLAAQSEYTAAGLKRLLG